MSQMQLRLRIAFREYVVDLIQEGLVAPTGIEPVLSALKGPRVNQLHHGAKHTTNPTTQLYAVCFVETEEEEILVALPGLEPGLSALRGRRVNQLHHDARTGGLPPLQ